MNKLVIRPLVLEDYSKWLPLWNGNNLGQHNEDVTAKTWERLCDPKNTQVNGLAADMGGRLLGITHYILHPTTGHINQVCYMQDVYVDPAHRRKGIAKRMVEELTKIAVREKWARMYWLTQTGNLEAKAMYESFGVKLDFSFYVLPIS
ncbi:MAG: GNAT family N-acetyltransferase [Alphaproteobacteria bacterium]|nr:GNAT family N-acetyltransferase [Alphaproteobacteria bacterium]